MVNCTIFNNPEGINRYQECGIVYFKLYIFYEENIILWIQTPYVSIVT